MTSMNDLVVAVVVEVMTGLLSLLRAHKARTKNIVAVVVAFETMIYPSSLIDAKEWSIEDDDKGECPCCCRSCRVEIYTSILTKMRKEQAVGEEDDNDEEEEVNDDKEEWTTTMTRTIIVVMRSWWQGGGRRRRQGLQ